jgi:hypothetical protein
MSAFGVRVQLVTATLLVVYRPAHEARCGAQKPHSFLIDEQLGLKTKKGLIFAFA